MKKILKIAVSIGMVLSLLCGCTPETQQAEGEIIDINLNTASIEENEIDNQLVEKEIYKSKTEKFNTDIVIGDNFYATQLADIVLNFNNYEGKIIEIEGFALNNGYTFVGRYSTSAICPDCPTGYAFLEYEWHGEEILDLGTEETWIKVKGELKRGNDGMEYYYVDAYEIEVMDEWGIATVEN